MSSPTKESQDEAKLALSAEQNWSKYWDRVTEESPAPPGFGLFARLKRFLRRSGGLELAYHIIRKETGNPRGKMILEAGCGTGEISLRLAAQGNKLMMLDTSISALNYSKAQAEALGVPAFIIKGSIFHLPFKNDVFDFAFNIGVLDHFGPKHRDIAMEQMLSTIKPQARTVILTNDARSWIHSIAMNAARKKGIWHYGAKDAIRSLKYSFNSQTYELSFREYSRGFISQFEFLHYCIPEVKSLKWLFFRLFYILTFPLWFLNYFPGQYLISVIDKKSTVQSNDD